MLGAAAVAQSRIYLSYHTPRQVYAGVLAGVVCAVGWFVVTSAARHSGVVDMLLETPVASSIDAYDVRSRFGDVCGRRHWELRARRRKKLVLSATGDALLSRADRLLL
ncbi:hypothetical protein LTR86_000451 [Recurvomyces mirabilis]|nr:hypothetical protein LTR86_000451 [Recurvomyces mirabilis]